MDEEGAIYLAPTGGDVAAASVASFAACRTVLRDR
jgi:hypothetical protein